VGAEVLSYLSLAFQIAASPRLSASIRSHFSLLPKLQLPLPRRTIKRLYRGTSVPVRARIRRVRNTCATRDSQRGLSYLTLDWMRDLEDFARRLCGAGWRDLLDVWRKR